MKLSLASKQGKPNSAVFWLLCVVVCYQIAYQAYISFVLSHDPVALDPWCGGGQGSAQQCVEAQLFQGWQSAGHEFLHDLHEPHPTGALLQHQENALPEPPTTAQPLPQAAPVTRVSLQEAGSSTVAASAAIINNNTRLHSDSNEALSPFAKSLIAIQERFEERMRRTQAARAARHAQRAHATIQEFHNMSTLSRDLRALHDRFDARLAERRDHTKSAQDELDHLTKWAKDVQALQVHFETKDPSRSQKADDMTPWSQDLSALQQRMEARMEAHNKAHHKLDEMDAHIEALKKAHHAPAEKHEVHSLLEQISDLGREMCSDAKHQHDPHCAQFLTAASVHASSAAAPGSHFLAATPRSLQEAEAKLKSDLHELAEKQHAWEKSFMTKVSDTMQDFCAEPLHRTQSSCMEFLKDHASHSGPSDEAAKKMAWHKSFAAKIANVGEELCSNPARRHYRICEKIFADKERAEKSTGTDTAAAATAEAEGTETTWEHEHLDGIPTDKLHDRLELHWSSVMQWQNRPRHVVNATIANINASEVSRLRTSAHWSGRIPSVACIAIVPQGDGAKVKAWINYFVDNFRLQKYEGSHRLVLVYHKTDQQAAELVHKYADGTYIQAAVARSDDYPSAAAFRFGAWIARSADVIARWDFGAWHHPQRLSMQVRALALTGRPAALLNGWTVLDKAGANTTVRDGEHWESSLVGEAAWMRTHWYPDMAEERPAFDAHAARDLVKLDAPGLEIFDEGM